MGIFQKENIIKNNFNHWNGDFAVLKRSDNNIKWGNHSAEGNLILKKNWKNEVNFLYNGFFKELIVF